LIAVENGVTEINYLNAAVCLGTLVLLQIKKLGKLHPLIWIVAGAVIGIIFKM